MRLFEPWVGSKYSTDGLLGRRVLVLGESHYGHPEEQTPSFTHDCVESLARGEAGHRFFTVVAKLLLNAPTGQPLAQGVRRDFWDRVAFYNYIQSFPGQKSRVRPTEEMWSEAAGELPAVLEQLRPDLVLVLGRALSARIPRIPSGTAVCAIPHPSSFGFKQATWRPHVQAALSATPGPPNNLFGEVPTRGVP